MSKLGLSALAFHPVVNSHSDLILFSGKQMSGT